MPLILYPYHKVPETTIKQVLFNLTHQGYSLLKLDIPEPTQELHQAYLSALRIIGQVFSKSYAWKIICGQQEQDFLPIHTESIYVQKIPSFFALAVLKQADSS